MSEIAMNAKPDSCRVCPHKILDTFYGSDLCNKGAGCVSIHVLSGETSPKCPLGKKGAE